MSCFLIKECAEEDLFLLKFRIVFWDVLPCKIIVDNYFTLQYIPENKSELHARRRENLKSHDLFLVHSIYPISVHYIVTYSGVLFTMELYCTPKSQHTTVRHSQQLSEHTYTSNLYGLGTLTRSSNRTSCGNLPTRTHIPAVRKSPNTRRDNPSSGYRSTCTPEQHLGV
jgi:hypothetical protein